MTYSTKATYDQYDFGVTDHRGKEMGVHVAAGEVTNYGDDDAGPLYWFRGQATRQGLCHGPNQNRRHFTKAAARDAAVTKYIRAAKSRAVRAAAKAAAAEASQASRERIAQPEGMVKGLGNCGVVAVAACANVPYDIAWGLLAGYVKARQGVRAWTGGTFAHERAKALTALGVDFQREYFSPRQSFGKWARSEAEAGSTYMVTVTGHVVTYKDGVFMDQCGSGPIEGSCVGRKQLRAISKIL